LPEKTGGSITVLRSLEGALEGSDVVVTDTWVSMGKEAEKAERVATFGSFQVDAAAMKKAHPDAIFLHCLPADRGFEVTPEVIDGPQSVIWDESENRLHAQKALNGLASRARLALSPASRLASPGFGNSQEKVVPFVTDRVVLAYSGGLDTSVGIGWLKDATGKEVIALAVDVGQGGENMDDIRQRALDCGAAEAIVVDAKDEFANDFVMPALKANALYQKRYPLVSALSRPVIAKHLARVAKELGADSVAHGLHG